MNQKTITRAVIPAAGLGTRFLPATKATPKEMLPIVDKPTIQYIVEEALASGIEDILIITGRNKRAIEDHFDRSIELELNLAEKGKDEWLEMAGNGTEYFGYPYPLYSPEGTEGAGACDFMCQAVYRQRTLCSSVRR